MSKNYGFARCSLGEERGQDLNRQVRELEAAGAEEIITERVHGDAKVKPQLDFLLEHIEPNSSLYVTEVSRLSRSRAINAKAILLLAFPEPVGAPALKRLQMSALHPECFHRLSKHPCGRLVHIRSWAVAVPFQAYVHGLNDAFHFQRLD